MSSQGIKKVLVIGGTGMLGMPVVFKLALKGFDVRVLVRSPRKATLIFGNIVEIKTGDVTRIGDLRSAMTGCDAVHINLSGQAELDGTRNVVSLAKETGIKLISYISGISAADEKNAWFEPTARKIEAEKAVASSGVNFLIFRPTWFMESIPLFVKDNKAFFIGPKNMAFHFLGAEDYANIVARMYTDPKTWNRTLHLLGPEKISFYKAIERYCKIFHPDIHKVRHLSVGMAKFLAFITYSSELKDIASLMEFFSKIEEPLVPWPGDLDIDPPKTTFDQWLEKRKKLSDPNFFEQIN